MLSEWETERETENGEERKTKKGQMIKHINFFHAKKNDTMAVHGEGGESKGVSDTYTHKDEE